MVELLIRSQHRRLLHAGLRSTHAAIKEVYWLPRVRQQVKKVLKKCVTCNRLQSRPFNELAAPLPIERVRNVRPFDSTGVDFAGPVYYKPYKFELQANTGTSEAPSTTGEEAPPPTNEGENNPTDENLDNPESTPCANTTQKAYICLFTCAYTRAVHLELVRDLSAPTFLLALRRFLNARGGCSKLMSDNAQTFSCVSKHLKALRTNNSICDFLAGNNIKWQFSAALAPWWGGFWERMVRSVKELFRKANGRAILHYDQLQTALSDIEAVINARPLTYVADDEDGPRTLTPNSLLVGYPPRGGGPQPPPPEPTENSSHHSLITMDKKRRNYVRDCGKQFMKEYLTELNQFHLKRTPTRKIQLGEVVVIHDNNAKRLMWTTGVVKELLPGRDGLIRSAVVKVPSGATISRAIQCLFPLELQEDRPEAPPAEETIQPTETAPSEAPDPAQPTVTINAQEEEEPPERVSGGEDVVNIFRRRAGARPIRLTARARANAAGER